MRKGFWASFLKLSLYDHRFEHTHNIRVKLVGKTGVPFVGPLTVLYYTVHTVPYKIVQYCSFHTYSSLSMF